MRFLVPIATALLLLLLVLPGSQAGPSLMAAPPSSAALFLQAAQPAAGLIPPGVTAPLGTGPLGTSVFPHTDDECSVQQDSVPNVCSVIAGQPGNKCSAHCDSGQICSTWERPLGATGDPKCSVFGRDRKGCSVLFPIVDNFQIAECSARTDIIGARGECSIMAPGTRQQCTAQNALNAQGWCSVFSDGVGQCSVLGGGTAARNFCTVRGAGDKECSAFGIQGNSCSIRAGERGRCTSFTTAPAASCSAFSGLGEFCSVIGGAPGNPCVQ